MMEDWKINRIEDLSKTTSGGTPSRKNKEYYCGNILWVKSGELEDNYIIDTEEKITLEAVKKSSAKLFPKGTILIAMYGATVGKTAILKKEATTNQAICGIFPNNDNFNNEFLRYQLIFKREDFLKQRYGGAQPNISQTIIKKFEVIIPPLPEQCKIAHVLSRVQKAIEQQDKFISTTIELKKALMQKLFTEGIKGELQKETEIGLVPESWEVKPFSDIFEIIKTQSHSRNKLTYEKTDTKILNIHYGDIHAKFKDNIVDLELEKIPCIIDKHVDENKNNFLKDEDIVIADASEDLIDIGKCIELKNVKNKKIIGGLHTIVARDKNNLIQKGFGAYIFKNKHVSTEISLIATGLSVYGISKGNLLKMLIPIPPSQEQVEIAETMDRCNKKIFYHQKKKQTLTDLFKTLLHELMTGERRVHKLNFDEININVN